MLVNGLLLQKTVPFKKVSVTNNDKPWMTIHIKDLIKERQRPFCSGKETRYTNLKSVKALMGMEEDRRDLRNITSCNMSVTVWLIILLLYEIKISTLLPLRKMLSISCPMVEYLL